MTAIQKLETNWERNKLKKLAGSMVLYTPRRAMSHDSPKISFIARASSV